MTSSFRRRTACRRPCLAISGRQPSARKSARRALCLPSAMALEGLRFGRRLVVPDLVLALGELAVIGYPLYDSYFLDDTQKALMAKAGPIAILLGGLVWYVAVRAWLD